MIGAAISELGAAARLVSGSVRDMSSSRSLVLYDPQETSPEVRTAAGFLAGYSARTREAYMLDLRLLVQWCGQHRLGLFDITRTHIELYARELEELGRAPATIGRRLSTLAGFYRYATEEGVIDHSPAVHVRRPKLDYESHAVGLDRNELGAFLVQAGLSSAQDHALSSLLALNGLRISEALGANIDQLGLERGHRTLVDAGTSDSGAWQIASLCSTACRDAHPSAR